MTGVQTCALPIYYDSALLDELPNDFLGRSWESFPHIDYSFSIDSGKYTLACRGERPWDTIRFVSRALDAAVMDEISLSPATLAQHFDLDRQSLTRRRLAEQAYDAWRIMIGEHILPPYDGESRDSSGVNTSRPFFMGYSGSPDFNSPGPETLQLLWERTLFKDEQRILDKRKIALTESGRLGLVSSRAVEGDVVCRFRGSKIFFVLHPIEVESSPKIGHKIEAHFGDRIFTARHYKFAGECVFDGTRDHLKGNGLETRYPTDMCYILH